MYVIKCMFIIFIIIFETFYIINLSKFSFSKSDAIKNSLFVLLKHISLESSINSSTVISKFSMNIYIKYYINVRFCSVSKTFFQNLLRTFYAIKKKMFFILAM